MVESRSCVQREGVYHWFSSLTSAQRAEFLCGLLDLCVPIELRFLGSCLEDLARKDYHSLRDAEIKANNPADLSGLTNVTDEVVRSKLLVSLALLGSDNREAAVVLYRTLTHIDTVINNYGLSQTDGATEEQFLLLFTMASHHPAFSFHQKQVLRQKLGQIQDILQVSRGGAAFGVQALGSERVATSYAVAPQHYLRHATSTPLGSVVPPGCSASAASSYPPPSACQPCYTHCTCRHTNQTKENRTPSGQGSGVTAGRQDQGKEHGPHSDPPPSPPPPPPAAPPPPLGRNHLEKGGKVSVERVVLRGVTHKAEESTEVAYEACWSHGFVSSVVRTIKEVKELLTQLLKAFPNDGLEKFLSQSVELDPRCLTALPDHVLQHHSVQLFFTASLRPRSPGLPPLPSPPPAAPVTPPCPFTSSSGVGCMVQFRGTTRAIYRVASVQPVVSTHSAVFTRPSPHLSSLPPPVSTLPAQCSLAMGAEPLSQQQQHGAALLFSPPTQSSLKHHLLPSSPAHHQALSYAHTRSQASCQAQAGVPEQNGILDWLRRLRLHKYYPVFKQLTMEEFLALTEEDLNKYDLTQGAKKKLKTQLELQKSVEEMKLEKRPFTGIARVTPSSHAAAVLNQCPAELRVEVDSAQHQHPVCSDSSSSSSSSSSGYSSSSCSPRTPLCCSIRDAHRRVSHDAPGGLLVLNSGRPTAQVLPVQTDPPPPPPPPPPPLPPSCSFGLPQPPYPPPAAYHPHALLSPARILSSPRKLRPSPLSAGLGLRPDSVYPSLGLDGSSPLQGPAAVETSSATTSTSNSLYHVSQPPLHFHLSSSCSSSSSSPPSPPGYYSCQLAPSSSSSSGSASKPPVAAVSGHTFHPPPLSPSSPAGTALDQGPGPGPPPCVCSSCGCRVNCATYGPLPGYAAAAGYLQSLSAGPSLFTLGPLLHLSPLLSPTSTAGSTSAAPYTYPLMMPPPLYRHGHEQQSYAFYQPHGIVGNQRRHGAMAGGILSCYNCGGNGHRAEECKQPSMDSVQQGTFRLKYTPHSDTKDSGD